MHFSILVANDRKMWAHIVLIAAVKSIVLLQSSVYVASACADMAERLRSRLQSGLSRFDSGCRLSVFIYSSGG